MSLHYEIDTFQNIEPFQTSEFEAASGEGTAQLTLVQHVPPQVTLEDPAERLRNGARILSFDEQSHAALCTQDDGWSVWLLDADGEPIRGSYFGSFRAAAFDYAEYVMGCHVGFGESEPSFPDE